MATESPKASKAAPKAAPKAERLSLPRLISNVGYLVSRAFRLDPGLVILILVAFVVITSGYGLLDTFLFKLLIDQLTNPAVSFGAVAGLVGGIAATALVVQFLDALMQLYAQARLVRLTGRMQEEFMRQAATMDLICYDHPAYYDDFVVAAAQADEMITTGLFSLGRIMGNVAGIATAGLFILTVNPLVALIPITGFVVNIVTRFAITRIEYDYDMERRRLMRRADYSRRVFYQPEYAKEIKLSGVSVPLRHQFNQAIDDIQDKARQAGLKIALLSLVNWIVVFTFLSYFLAPLYLAWLVMGRKSISFGAMVSMDNAQNNVRNQLDGMNYALVDFQRTGLFCERFRRFMDYRASSENAPGATPPATPSLSTLPGEPAGTPPAEAALQHPHPPAGPAPLLEIDHLSFRYAGASQDTIHDLCLTIRAGEHIAIVGENGAGKSTLIKLVMRLYEPTGGCIRFAGRDIRDYATNEYRRLIAPVFQDYQLYGTSLAENVLMDHRLPDSAGPDCHPDGTRPHQDARLRHALHLADFGSKLDRLPQGLDTPMTREFNDEGTMLSGGESQKVAIARLFARTGPHGQAHHNPAPPALSLAILDEPSSALDPRAEHILNRNMLDAAGQAAVIFISHRLSTTRDAHRIYLLDQGRIAEQGTHEELLRLGGSYATMFDTQAHYYQD